MTEKIFSYVSVMTQRVWPFLFQVNSGKKRRLTNEQLAQKWVAALEGDEFEKLKKDIFRIIISTYYQKKFGLEDTKAELSVYDIARDEKDLIKLNKMNNEGWRKIIEEMVAGSLEITDLFEHKRYKGKVQFKAALINIPVLRRASIKIVG